jgi:HEAT repeat protein
MLADLLTALAEDVRRLLRAGAAAAAGDEGLRRRLEALRPLAGRVPALAVLARSVQDVAEAAEPAAALLELQARVRPARAALAESGVAGDLAPVPPSGPWRTPAAAAVLYAAAAALRQRGAKGHNALAALADSGGAGDLRLREPLLAALVNPYGATADLVAQRLLPPFGPALAPELRAGLNLPGKAADGRRLLALAQLDKRGGRELCRTALREGAPVVRAAALRGLAVAAPEEAEREAVAALSGPAPGSLKGAALDLLRERATAVEGAVPALVRLALLGDYRWEWRARQALARQGRAAVPALVKALQDPSPERRRDAIWVLMDIGPEAGEATEALVAALRDEAKLYSYRIGDCARAALARIGPPARAAVPALREELERGDAELRFHAAEALVKITGEVKRYLPALIEGLSSPDIGIRRDAAEALGQIGPAAKAAVPALIRVLKDRPGNVCHFAAVALGRIGHNAEEVVPFLIDLVGSDRYYYRRDAVEALGLFGPKARAALPILQEVAKERSRYMQEVVGPALAAIQGTAKEAGGGQ